MSELEEENGTVSQAPDIEEEAAPVPQETEPAGPPEVQTEETDGRPAFPVGGHQIIITARPDAKAPYGWAVDVAINKECEVQAAAHFMGRAQEQMIMMCCGAAQRIIVAKMEKEAEADAQKQLRRVVKADRNGNIIAN